MFKQLEFSFVNRFEEPLPTPNEIVDEWLTEPAPLVHVFGENPHIVCVTTFRSYDEPVWVNRDWLEDRLQKGLYKATHTLSGNFLCKRTTTAGPDKAVVYQPFNRKRRG